MKPSNSGPYISDAERQELLRLLGVEASAPAQPTPSMAVPPMGLPDAARGGARDIAPSDAGNDPQSVQQRSQEHAERIALFELLNRRSQDPINQERERPSKRATPGMDEDVSPRNEAYAAPVVAPGDRRAAEGPHIPVAPIDQNELLGYDTLPQGPEAAFPGQKADHEGRGPYQYDPDARRWVVEL